MRAILPVLLGLGLTALGCASDPGDEAVGDQDDALGTAPSAESVLSDIRDGALSHGIKKGWLIAGVAKVETELHHCRPARQFCAGPASSDCGGGPVLAGGADGTCRQGGLGLFQLDEVTQTATVNAYKARGIDVLTVEGNVEAGIYLLLEKMQLNGCLSGISSEAEAVAWLNDVALGGSDYGEYTGMLAHCYNGWDVGQPGWRKQKAKYDAGIRDVLELHGASWWANR
ncbi:MAG: Tryptophan synthase alpha chain [Labilithrix sp.]|nr:Tryptophan synthase alpha chain [Labilithrix sp.]